MVNIILNQINNLLQGEIDSVRNTITTPKTPDSSSSSTPPIVKEKADKLKREWKENDPTVPRGWKVAWTTTSDNRAKIAFMSPDKKIFHSRKSALQYILAEGTYEQSDIEKMTKGLNVLLNVGDEWKAGMHNIIQIFDWVDPLSEQIICPHVFIYICMEFDSASTLKILSLKQLI